MKEMLDRGIASMEWRIKYPKASVTHPGAVRSDHNPFLLDTNPPNFFSPCSFRFEVAWTRDLKAMKLPRIPCKLIPKAQIGTNFLESNKPPDSSKEVE